MASNDLVRDVNCRAVLEQIRKWQPLPGKEYIAEGVNAQKP
jgi:hypothetical protein